MSYPVFWKSKKNITNLLSAESAKRVVIVQKHKCTQVVDLYIQASYQILPAMATFGTSLLMCFFFFFFLLYVF